MVAEIAMQTPLPARVMLRERADFFVSGVEEIALLERRAREFVKMGVEGIVTGYVKDRGLDLDALGALIEACGAHPVTVHNAIEQTGDPAKALRALRSFPTADRALVRAGSTVDERVERLPEYERAIGPDKLLVLGGDLRLDMLSELRRRTNIRIFHLGRAVRTPERADGRVDAAKVRKAIQILSAAGGAARPIG